jgi:hypothetical protein
MNPSLWSILSLATVLDLDASKSCAAHRRSLGEPLTAAGEA